MVSKLTIAVVLLAVALGYVYNTSPLTNPKSIVPLSRQPLTEDHFINKNGLAILTRTWLPTDNTPIKGRIFLAHGYGEHIHRYDWVGKQLNKHGYEVYGLDHQGHGKSEGDRAYIEYFDDYIDDFAQHVERVLSKDKREVPNFLLGHSLGGAIGLHVAHRNQSLWRAAYFSGPAVVVDPVVAKPHLVLIAGILSTLVPKWEVPGDSVPSERVCRDPEVVKLDLVDPLAYHGNIKARFGEQVLKAVHKIRDEIGPQIQYPFLVAHGTDDYIVMPIGSQMLYDIAIQSKQRKIIMYEGLYHEILNEPEKDKVLLDLVNWFDSHL